MHRKTKRPAEHLDYWATGLLGYWATEQSAGKKKFAFSSTCLVTPIYPERKRVWRSTLPGFCLLLTLFENLCMLAVFSCFCASNGTRGRLFPSYPLAFPIADCFRFLPFLFQKGFFWLPTSTVPRAVVVADVHLSNPPIVLVLIVIVHCHSQL